MKIIFLIFVCSIVCSCTSHQNSSAGVLDSQNVKITVNNKPEKNGQISTDSTADFERRIYLKIDEIKTGKVYTNKNNSDVFYRVLIVPEEENIMLLAENISIGEEGGNFKLVKLSRITDDNSALPKFGLGSVDSLKFIDSVRIQGYFNNKKMIINLDKLKNYHISY